MKIGDAFGKLLTAGLEQDGVLEVVERDDGFVSATRGSAPEGGVQK